MKVVKQEEKYIIFNRNFNISGNIISETPMPQKNIILFQELKIETRNVFF